MNLGILTAPGTTLASGRRARCPPADPELMLWPGGRGGFGCTPQGDATVPGPSGPQEWGSKQMSTVGPHQVDSQPFLWRCRPS
jgi:hypothetical protein